MKMKRTNRDEVRENSLNVPMTIIEKDQVRKAADSMGVSMSTLVRIALNEYLKKAGAK
jgi:antitoxin component of RelBE/YafQ-DinJ toxin-antitoxin module